MGLNCASSLICGLFQINIEKCWEICDNLKKVTDELPSLNISKKIKIKETKKKLDMS